MPATTDYLRANVTAAQAACDELRASLRSMTSSRNPRGAQLKRQLRASEADLARAQDALAAADQQLLRDAAAATDLAAHVAALSPADRAALRARADGFASQRDVVQAIDALPNAGQTLVWTQRHTQTTRVVTFSNLTDAGTAHVRDASGTLWVADLADLSTDLSDVVVDDHRHSAAAEHGLSLPGQPAPDAPVSGDQLDAMAATSLAYRPACQNSLMQQLAHHVGPATSGSVPGLYQSRCTCGWHSDVAGEHIANEQADDHHAATRPLALVVTATAGGDTPADPTDVFDALATPGADWRRTLDAWVNDDACPMCGSAMAQLDDCVRCPSCGTERV